MYTISWSPKAQDDLSSLDREIVVRIIDRIEKIKYTPYHFIEKLADIAAWKLRVGDYRVILDINEKEKTIEVLKIGHRKNIYKTLVL
jgi:mRNA interferase RelE/StbE